MDKVYLLKAYEAWEEPYLIGIYSTLEKAEEARKKIEELWGDAFDIYLISEAELDKKFE